MQYRFLCTKTIHTMINMSILHACFVKIHKFSCVLVYFWIRKNQTVCSQATINFVYFFQIFGSKGNTALIKMHLAFRVSTRMQNKRTSAQTGQRPCILHLFLTSCEHARAHQCRLISMFIFCYTPTPEGGERKRGQRMF